MNFVTKNLGWILLLLFFLFMLFVISSNDGNITDTHSWAIIGLMDTGATQENLDSLVGMIDNDDVSSELLKEVEENIIEEATIGEEVISGEVSLKEKKKGFFSFLGFGKNKEEETEDPVGVIEEEIKEKNDEEVSEKADEKETEENNEETEDVEAQEEIDENKEEKQGFFSRIFSREENAEDVKVQEEIVTSTWDIDTQVKWDIVNPRDQLIGLAWTEDVNVSVNMMKKSETIQEWTYADTQEYSSQAFKNMYPGMNLETQIGKSFEVGVHALKLNNKYFNKTLGYVARGDVLTQLTSENSYGCFQVEVVSSQQTWYVCKKYLQNTTQNTGVTINTTVEKVEVVDAVIVNTQIGDLIMIEQEGVMMWAMVLQIGDIIDQMSQGDENGCFIAHVYSSSSTERQGQTGWVCVNELY